MIEPSQPASNVGTLEFYYNLDPATQPWVQFLPSGGPISQAVPVDFYGPSLESVDYSKIAIVVVVVASAVPYHGSPVTNSYLARVLRIGLEEKLTATYYGLVTASIGIIRGDGAGGHYGNLHRAFPGQTPVPNQPAFTATTLNHYRIKLRKHVDSDTLDSAYGVEVRLYDASDPENSAWSLGTIPASAITASWKDFAFKFSPTTTVQGQTLQVEVRTLNTKEIEVDHLGLWRGDTITAWSPSPQEHANGFFGNFKHGDSISFSQGSWGAGSWKSSPVV